MKMAALMRRCHEPDFKSWISVAEAFAMATVDGAGILGINTGKNRERLFGGHLHFEAGRKDVAAS